jgi:hypothetical protein
MSTVRQMPSVRHLDTFTATNYVKGDECTEKKCLARDRGVLLS